MTKRHLPRVSLIIVCGVAAWAGLTLACLALVIWPAASYRGRIAAAQAQLSEAKSSAAALTIQLSAAGNDLADIQRALAEHPLKLDSTDHFNGRLSQVTAFCKTCGLEIQDLNPGPPSPGAGYDTFSIHLAGHGSYRSCMLLLHQLHERFLDLSVTSFRLSVNAEDPSQPLSAQFDIRWCAKRSALAVTQ